MQSRQPLSRPVRAALLVGAALTLLAGCEPGQFGLSGRDAEWARRGAFSVVSASSQRAVLSAEGNQIAVEPSPGFCLAEDEIGTSDRSAFVLIGDCVMDSAPTGDGARDLPPSMPGIMTVSLSGDPGFSSSGASARDLSQLETYLDTPEGRALLGRGGDGAQVSVIDTRRQGDILYVLVEDRDGAAVPVLAPRFWRAFVELNERLAVVTVSGFRDVPMDEEEMLRHLGDQVRQLQLANAVPVEEAPVQYAEKRQGPRPRPAETGSGDQSPDAVELAMAAAGKAARDEAAADDTLPGETASLTADPAWDALMASTETAEAGEMAHAATTLGPEWAELARAEADQPEERGAVGGPEQGDEGWLELAQPDRSAETGAEAEKGTGDALDEDTVGIEPNPLIVASTATGARGPWPMPAARPGAATAWPRAAAAAAPRAAPSPRPSPEPATGVPMPPPRLIDPPDRAAAQAPAFATPMPAPRKRP